MIKAVIPAKACSTRVPDKNFKPFWGDYSLVDLTIKKLIPVFECKNIYLSCEDPEVEAICDTWGINFILRDKGLCDNSVPIPDWIRGVCAQVPGDDDLAWCQVIDPLFNDYQKMMDEWNHHHSPQLKATADISSLTAIYPFKDYMLDCNSDPMGWNYGAWHVTSQNLMQNYRMTFVCSFLTRASIKETGYHIGSKPYWHLAKTPHVDIDTEQDFFVAQKLYEAYYGAPPKHELKE